MLPITSAAPSWAGTGHSYSSRFPSILSFLASGATESGKRAMNSFRLLANTLAAMLLVLACGSASAFDFRSVGPNSVVLYDAPSLKSARRYIAPPGMPVEIVSRYGAWVKVRDIDGDMAWTEAKGLSARRTIVVKAPMARIRAAADDNAALLMTADKGVLLELVDPRAGEWIRVRHQDGIGGFVRASEIWGI